MTWPQWIPYVDATVVALYAVAFAAFVVSFVLARQQPTRLSLWTLWTAFALHSLSLALKGWRLEQIPIAGMFGALSFIAWSVALCFIFLQAHLGASSPGVFIMPFVVAFAGVSAALGRGQPAASELLDQLRGQSLLFGVHMASALFSYSCFAIAFAAGLMYLLLSRELHSKRLGYFSRRMPPLDTIDKINTHAMGLGLSLLAIGIVSGAIGLALPSARGNWGDNAKTVTALLIWTAYFVNLSLAIRGKWRGRRAAAVSSGLFCMVFVLYFVVNLLFTKIHGGAW